MVLISKHLVSTNESIAIVRSSSGARQSAVNSRYRHVLSFVDTKSQLQLHATIATHAANYPSRLIIIIIIIIIIMFVY